MSGHKLYVPTQSSQTEASSAQTTIVGKAIIYRRPEVTINIDHRTAGFVASSGSDFESVIQQNKAGDPKLNFRNVSDPSSDKENGEQQRGEENKNIVLSPSLPSRDGQALIIKNYNPKRKAAKAARPAAYEDYLISPLTGERIAASQIQQNMRIGLLDPRWMEQRDKDVDKKSRETVFAPGSTIEDSLKQLAERRTDIFGVGDETSIGKKIGEEDMKKGDNGTWNGHMSRVKAASRAAKVNITLEEQIRQIHKAKSLLPDKKKEKIGPKPVTQASKLLTIATGASAMNSQNRLTMMGFTQTIIPQPPVHLQSPCSRRLPLSEEESSSKKFCAENSLIPEQQFLTRNKGPVQLRIAVPLMADGTGWKLNGQTLEMILEPSDTVSIMKTHILQQTGMPSGKQKLRYKGFFLKDTNSLAYYNITSGNFINLQQKERGGRKK